MKIQIMVTDDIGGKRALEAEITPKATQDEIRSIVRQIAEAAIRTMVELKAENVTEVVSE